jgi:hypothetical protein
VARRVRRVVVGLVLVLAVAPGIALAVRPSVSASLVFYRGSDAEGPVSFSIFSDNGIGSISDMRFATECAPAGRSVRGTIIVRERGNGAIPFSYHRPGFRISGRISATGSRVTGTVRLDTPRCDSDVLPFRATALS